MRKIKVIYCCKDCGTKIDYRTGLFGNGRCTKCYNHFHLGNHNITKKELIQYYLIDLTTPLEIGKKLNVSQSYIKKLLKKYKIKTRNISIAQKITTKNKGKNSKLWKGGKYKDNGYILVYSPDHPNKNSKGYVQEHRLVVEKKLKRYLTKEERVHHKDENKINNKKYNLFLCKNLLEHQKLHRLAYRYLVKTNKINDYLKWFTKENFK